MAKSLQDQLRQAGIANQKQVVRARKAKNTKEKMQRKGQDIVDETAELVKKRDAEKLNRDRALNEQKNKAAQEKALQAQIRQLIELNAITERGDIEFRFDHAGTIKTLLLTKELRQALINGFLAIVGLNDELSVVPAKVALKIAERDQRWQVLLNSRSEEIAADDEYADYAVPDDLMW
ncbi:MAG: DUF2058 domain-containing protein [Granulosicoccus sp.]